MVEAINSNMTKPVYNAVNINIKKPEVNIKENNNMTLTTDNGVYNAVKINIDNPTVNPIDKKIYDYPEAKGFVSYEMTGFVPVQIPPVTVPQDLYNKENETLKEAVKVPEPNYTTTEKEKGEIKKIEENKNIDFKETNTEKKLEIVPGEEIKPEVDLHQVISNLRNADFDVQAQQMEEITRKTLEDSTNAIPYIVRFVFTNRIDLAHKSTKELQGPTQKQIEARKKIIEDFIALEKNPELKELPHKLSEQEIELANKLSPMEMAERNKEYAIYTIAVLAKVYTDEVAKHTGNVVPMTEIPGISDIVDELRYNENAGVKVAAVDALGYIAKPEYKEELTEIFTIAQADKNPAVSKSADIVLQKINS